MTDKNDAIEYLIKSFRDALPLPDLMGDDPDAELEALTCADAFLSVAGNSLDQYDDVVQEIKDFANDTFEKNKDSSSSYGNNKTKSIQVLSAKISAQLG